MKASPVEWTLEMPPPRTHSHVITTALPISRPSAVTGTAARPGTKRASDGRAAARASVEDAPTWVTPLSVPKRHESKMRDVGAPFAR